jgi:fatty-acyl-CoA synthase
VVRYDPRTAAASDYERWIAAYEPTDPGIDTTEEDDFLVIYTSGTTGTPKGVHFKQRQPMVYAPVAVIHCELKPDSRLLMVYPHNSIASVNSYYVPAWMMGATVVLSDARGFSAERWLAEVEREAITHSFLVPTMLIRILDSGAVPSFDVSSLVTIGYGSASIPRQRVEELCAVFGDVLLQGYGMTETSAMAVGLTKADHRAALEGDGRKLASCGRPIYGCEVRVVNEAGEDVGPGEAGEVIFRGPLLFSGYWNDPERTAAAVRGGWLYSGDIAEVDEDGFLYIVDRKSDLIISGAYNVSSKEVEEVLGWHDAVAEVAVVARPDPEWGEKVHAFVVRRGGGTAGEAELIAFCRGHLARIKCPDRIEFVDGLPRNALGKLVKGELRERVRAAAKAMAR